MTSDGYIVWFDEEDLLPGQNWQEEIKKAIKESRLFIIYLSKNLVSKKGFIQREIREAWEVLQEYPNGTVYVIPIVLEPCEIPDSFNDLQCADLSDDDGYPRLLESIRRVLNETPLRERAEALFNGYLVRVRIQDRDSLKPIKGALVEVNQLIMRNPTRFSKLEEVEVLSVLRHNVNSASARTGDEGFVYFSLSQDFIFDPKVRFVVSTTASGYDVAHKELNFTYDKILLLMALRQEPILVLGKNEVGELTPDEDILLTLSQSIDF